MDTRILDMKQVVHPDSWLGMYTDYLNPTIDAPDQFGIVCGLSCLSMVCRDLYIPYGQNRIRPNLWIGIVAPSTRYRKSTSIGVARRIMESVEPGIVFPDTYSPEGFIDHLANERPYGCFVWGEIKSTLSAFEKSYMRGHKEDLTFLYDCPETWNRKTKTSGLIKITNPYIGIIASSTQEWLNQCLTEGDLKGGFLPRFLWVIADMKSRFFAWPDTPDSDSQLIEHLMRIRESFAGEMEIDIHAKELFCDYVTQLDIEGAAQLEYEGILSAFYSRLGIYALKFAMLYQADIQSMTDSHNKDRVITMDAMQYAICWSEYLKQNISELLGSAAFNELMANRIKVLKLIQAKPGIARSETLKYSRLSKRDFDESIVTLIESEQIFNRVEQTQGRPKTSYYPGKS